MRQFSKRARAIILIGGGGAIALLAIPRVGVVRAFDLGYFLQKGSAGMAEHEARQTNSASQPVQKIRANDTNPSRAAAAECPPSAFLPEPTPYPMPAPQAPAAPAVTEADDFQPGETFVSNRRSLVKQALELKMPQSGEAIRSRFGEPTSTGDYWTYELGREERIVFDMQLDKNNEFYAVSVQTNHRGGN